MLSPAVHVYPQGHPHWTAGTLTRTPPPCSMFDGPLQTDTPCHPQPVLAPHAHVHVDASPSLLWSVRSAESRYQDSPHHPSPITWEVDADLHDQGPVPSSLPLPAPSQLLSSADPGSLDAPAGTSRNLSRTQADDPVSLSTPPRRLDRKETTDRLFSQHRV
jgi:hypothetical protein